MASAVSAKVPPSLSLPVTERPPGSCQSNDPSSPHRRPFPNLHATPEPLPLISKRPSASHVVWPKFSTKSSQQNSARSIFTQVNIWTIPLQEVSLDFFYLVFDNLFVSKVKKKIKTPLALLILNLVYSSGWSWGSEVAGRLFESDF